MIHCPISSLFVGLFLLIYLFHHVLSSAFLTLRCFHLKDHIVVRLLTTNYQINTNNHTLYVIQFFNHLRRRFFLQVFMVIVIIKLVVYPGVAGSPQRKKHFSRVSLRNNNFLQNCFCLFVKASSLFLPNLNVLLLEVTKKT